MSRWVGRPGRCSYWCKHRGKIMIKEFLALFYGHIKYLNPNYILYQLLMINTEIKTFFLSSNILTFLFIFLDTILCLCRLLVFRSGKPRKTRFLHKINKSYLHHQPNQTYLYHQPNQTYLYHQPCKHIFIINQNIFIINQT